MPLSPPRYHNPALSAVARYVARQVKIPVAALGAGPTFAPTPAAYDILNSEHTTGGGGGNAAPSAAATGGGGGNAAPSAAATPAVSSPHRRDARRAPAVKAHLSAIAACMVGIMHC